MRKYLLFLVAGSVVACTTTQTEKNDSKSVIGYDISEEGEQRELIAGPLTTVSVWEDYVQAHNNKDLDAIASLNAEDIKIWGPGGEFIEGSDNHIAFLNDWFTANNPVWKSNYFIANEVIVKDGENRQWVTSGHDVTQTLDSIKVTSAQVHDGLIVDGKVKMFYVYERAIPAPQKPETEAIKE